TIAPISPSWTTWVQVPVSLWKKDSTSGCDGSVCGMAYPLAARKSSMLRHHGVGHFVKPNQGFHVEQVLVVLVVVHRAFRLLAGVGVQRLHGVPQGQHLELALLALHPPQHPRAVLALELPERGQRGLLQVFEVSVGLIFRSDASPDAHDHGKRSVSGPCDRRATTGPAARPSLA